MRIWAAVADGLARRGAAVVVTILSSAGSTPREAGTRMVVFADGSFTGTIGGGTLEWRAIAEAQRVMGGGATLAPDGLTLRSASSEARLETRGEVDPLSHASRRPQVRPPQHEGEPDTSSVPLSIPFHDRTYALGPELGQCCGGRVTLRFEPVTQADRDAVVQRAEAEAREDYHRPLYLFGAGHVGRALTLALAPFAFDVTWIDPRRDAFPAAAPQNVRMIAPSDPVAQLAHASADAFVLIMTHSHELDLALCDAALRRDFSYIGVIGSATKRARFETRLRQAGLAEAAVASLVCPIGAGGPKSKLPAAIAAATVVELLVADEQFARQTADVRRSDKMDSGFRRGLPVAGERGRVGGNKR